MAAAPGGGLGKSTWTDAYHRETQAERVPTRSERGFISPKTPIMAMLAVNEGSLMDRSPIETAHENPKAHLHVPNEPMTGHHTHWPRPSTSCIATIEHHHGHRATAKAFMPSKRSQAARGRGPIWALGISATSIRSLATFCNQISNSNGIRHLRPGWMRNTAIEQTALKRSEL